MVETAKLPEGTVRVGEQPIRALVHALFVRAGVRAGDAELVADVLVSADLRGVRSHGVARVPYFLIRYERGVLNPRPRPTIRRGSDTTAVLDADNGIGITASAMAMDEAVTMAQRHGSGFVAIANSNHFGYAGYWSRRAMDAGCIGISMANSGRRVTPTFGQESLLGTNPFSVGIPGAADATDFLLDMATSAVAVGKVETALREGRSVPSDWVAGTPELDERGVLTYGSPLLPLGGAGDVSGGHKGYGLSLMVELLCGALSGTTFEERIAGADGSAPAAMGQFVGAISLAGFGSRAEIATDMEKTFEIVRGATKAPGHERIFIHGEPEDLATEMNARRGIPITPAVQATLRTVADRAGVEVPW